MDIEYEFTPEDYIQFCLFSISNSPTSKRHMLVSQLIFFLIGCVMYMESNNFDLDSFGIGIIWGVIMFWVYPYISRFFYIRQIKGKLSESENKPFIGPQATSLSTEGIIERSQGVETKISWSSIQKIIQNDDYVFISLNAFQTSVIPKRAFPTESSLQEFLDYINARVETESIGHQPKPIQQG